MWLVGWGAKVHAVSKGVEGSEEGKVQLFDGLMEEKLPFEPSGSGLWAVQSHPCGQQTEEAVGGWGQSQHEGLYG